MLSCYLTETLDAYHSEIAAFQKLGDLDRKQTHDKIKLFYDKAKGFAYFGMQKQRDFRNLDLEASLMTSTD